MRISLVVPTLHRTHELQRLLESLCQQTHRDFEVLIADQNGPDFLRPLLDAYGERLPLRVFVIESHGVSAARNALLTQVTGDVVAFPDDDCFYAPDTLASVHTLFQQHADYAGIIGVWHLPPDAARYKPKTSRHRHWRVSRYTAFRRAETHVQFYRRQVVEAVGNFDERFGPGTGLPYGCGEDTDYLLRVLEASFQVVRCAAICSYHEPPALTQIEMAEKWRAYGMGRMALLKKHNMPLWFTVGNVVYPLMRALIEGPRAWGYRWHMFRGRLNGLFHEPVA